LGIFRAETCFVAKTFAWEENPVKSKMLTSSVANQLTNGGLNSVWQFGGEQAIVTISA
jgi:hypothetical protein